MTRYWHELRTQYALSRNAIIFVTITALAAFFLLLISFSTGLSFFVASSILLFWYLQAQTNAVRARQLLLVSLSVIIVLYCIYIFKSYYDYNHSYFHDDEHIDTYTVYMNYLREFYGYLKLSDDRMTIFGVLAIGTGYFWYRQTIREPRAVKTLLSGLISVLLLIFSSVIVYTDILQYRLLRAAPILLTFLFVFLRYKSRYFIIYKILASSFALILGITGVIFMVLSVIFDPPSDLIGAPIPTPVDSYTITFEAIDSKRFHVSEEAYITDRDNKGEIPIHIPDTVVDSRSIGVMVEEIDYTPYLITHSQVLTATLSSGQVVQIGEVVISNIDTTIAELPGNSFLEAKFQEHKARGYGDSERIAWSIPSRDAHREGVVFAFIPQPFQYFRWLIQPLRKLSSTSNSILLVFGALLSIVGTIFVSIVSDGVKTFLTSLLQRLTKRGNTVDNDKKKINKPKSPTKPNKKQSLKQGK